MKAARITSNNQFVQEGNFQAGTYTFNALVLATTGFYYIRFVASGGSGVTFSAEVTPNEWSRVEMTFTLNTTYSKLDLSYYTNSPVVVAAPMLEYGNNASTAAPNPDDIDEELDDLGGNIISMGTEITQTKSQIQLLANKTVQIEGDITSMEGALTVQATQIAGKVSQTDFNSLGQRVTSAEGALSVQATQIAAKVSQTIYDTNNVAISQQIAAVNVKADGISLKVDNLQIGGRNLIRNSKLDNRSSANANGCTLTPVSDKFGLVTEIERTSGSGGFQIQFTRDIPLGTRITLSIKYKNISGGEFMVGDSNNGGSAYYAMLSNSVYDGNVSLGGDWYLLWRTITYNGTGTFGINSCKGKFRVCQIQAEIGNKPTDWTASDMDMPSKLLATGIDIEEGEVRITAPKFKVQDNTGTPIAVFKIGEDGKPVIKAENIEITSSLIANAIQTAKLQVGDKFEVGTDGKIKAVDGEFSGKISSSNSGDRITIDPVTKKMQFISNDDLVFIDMAFDVVGSDKTSRIRINSYLDGSLFEYSDYRARGQESYNTSGGYQGVYNSGRIQIRKTPSYGLFSAEVNRGESWANNKLIVIMSKLPRSSTDLPSDALYRNGNQMMIK